MAPILLSLILTMRVHLQNDCKNIYRKAICFQRTIEFQGLEPWEAAAQAAEPTHALELLSGTGAGELLDELSHLLEGFEQLVHILHPNAGSGGDPLFPAGSDDLGLSRSLGVMERIMASV